MLAVTAALAISRVHQELRPRVGGRSLLGFSVYRGDAGLFSTRLSREKSRRLDRIFSNARSDSTKRMFLYASGRDKVLT